MLAALKVIFTFSNHTYHFLTKPVAFRYDQDTPYRQLVQEHLRNFRSSCCDQDSVKRLIGGQAFIAVAEEEDGLIVQRPQGFLCIKEKLSLPFYGIYPRTKFQQNSSLISGTGSNLQDLQVFFYIKQLGLKCNGVGLGYGLSRCNREGLICIGEVDKTAIHKEMPGNPAHGFKHIFIHDPLGSNGVYKLLSQPFMSKTIYIFHLDGQI